MRPLLVLAFLLVVAAAVARFYLLRRKASRRRRRRAARSYWLGYEKAWNSLFVGRRQRRLTYLDTNEDPPA